MKCHVCGSALAPKTTDMPFKVGETAIVILKTLPVLQCDQCGEYTLEDAVMARVEAILAQVDTRAEVEIIHFAA